MVSEEDDRLVDEVNELAEELRNDPGVAERSFVPMFKAVMMLLPVSLSAVAVVLDVYTHHTVPLPGADPRIAYTTIMLVGAFLSYLLYRRLYSTDESYKPGPGERIEL